MREWLKWVGQELNIKTYEDWERFVVLVVVAVDVRVVIVVFFLLPVVIPPFVSYDH